ncbi:hypothetical protein CROQUDRAFT_41834, partial [Cronartium quercuum f. sp. fusiforme G11]
QIFEKDVQFGLKPEDRDALLKGREAMIRYTRYGFMIGAMIAPIPLFRGKYAINGLANLPPLISRTTKKPDIEAIKSRMWWVTKSVAVTTVGSGIGTWTGFYLGLWKMEKAVDAVPGGRQRVERAFELARQDLGIPSAPEGASSPNLQRPSSDPNDPSTIFVPDEEFYQQQTFGNQDFQPTTPSSPYTPPPPRSSSSSPASVTSRWEELRREKGVGPSTWDTIRQQRAKTTPDSSSNSQSEPSDPREAERRAFEELLERERRISSGEPGASIAGSQRWS